MEKSIGKHGIEKKFRGKFNKPLKSLIPEWIGKHPFLPTEKRIMVITKDKELTILYGFEGHQVQSKIFVSTDKLLFCEWILPSGAYYEPPGKHMYGDELYYFLEGDPTAFNPESGEVYQLHAGDALLIPQGTRHQIFNFTNRRIKTIGIVAPKIWADDGMGTFIPKVKKPKFYKAE